jgi:hypothetical protein
MEKVGSSTTNESGGRGGRDRTQRGRGNRSTVGSGRANIWMGCYGKDWILLLAGSGVGSVELLSQYAIAATLLLKLFESRLNRAGIRWEVSLGCKHSGCRLIAARRVSPGLVCRCKTQQSGGRRRFDRFGQLRRVRKRSNIEGRLLLAVVALRTGRFDVELRSQGGRIQSRGETKKEAKEAFQRTEGDSVLKRDMQESTWLPRATVRREGGEGSEVCGAARAFLAGCKTVKE